jgi:RNA polymerase sigma factor (sigma-70 family)
LTRREDRVQDLVRVARDRHAPLRQRHAAFSLLVERFQAMALAVALQACDDPETARDACQNAFLLAWRTLHRLRDGAAFGGWIKRLVRTQCARARRHPRAALLEGTSPSRDHDPAERAVRKETHRLLGRAVRGLPTPEREVVMRVYFHGETLDEAGRGLRVTPAQAGKLVYRARLRLRRSLPRHLARAFLPTAPDREFTRRVEAGLLDEIEGTYLFPERPDRPVVVRREGSVLTAEAGGQKNVLASCRANRLAATEFDGEACLLRDRQGHVTGFVYYEFGQRLGVARRVAPAP